MFRSKKRKYNSLSDEELIVLYKTERESEIIGVLYERYAHLVLGACMKYLQQEVEAEDMLMSVFEKLPQRILRHEISYFRSWLYTLTRNECFMLLRSRKGKEHSTLFENNLEADDQQAEQLEKEALLDKLDGLLPELKSEQQTCIRLFYLEGKSYDAIADELHIPLKQVKSAIQNGKRNLKIKLENGK